MTTVISAIRKTGDNDGKSGSMDSQGHGSCAWNPEPEETGAVRISDRCEKNKNVLPSAGSDPGESISEDNNFDAIEAAREFWEPRLGKDISRHEAEQIIETYTTFFDLLVEASPDSIRRPANEEHGHGGLANEQQAGTEMTQNEPTRKPSVNEEVM